MSDFYRIEAPGFPECAEPCGACTEPAGEVVELPVGVGQRVVAGEVVAVLENNKATVEVAAPVAGTVAELLVSLGDPVMPLDALMTLAREE